LYPQLAGFFSPLRLYMAKADETPGKSWRLKLMLTLLHARSLLLGPGITLLLILPGCATPTATVATNKSVCEVWKPVSWSKKDTDQTITEVKVNNARREGWCHDFK
jgi:hypothetical protein